YIFLCKTIQLRRVCY
nr:immunoglobulin heavy chain junction region [Mus musculus]